MEVVVRYFDGCPHWENVRDRLRAALDGTGRRDTVVLLDKIGSDEDAERLRFIGSPTILVDGRDPFATGTEPVGFACRLYSTPAGLRGAPTQAQLEEILR